MRNKRPRGFRPEDWKRYEAVRERFERKEEAELGPWWTREVSPPDYKAYLEAERRHDKIVRATTIRKVLDDHGRGEAMLEAEDGELIYVRVRVFPATEDETSTDDDEWEVHR